MPVQPATLQIDDDPELVTWIKKNPLNIFRVKNHFSLRRAAIKFGTTPTTVSKWEDGTSYPIDENMKRIAEVISIPLDELKTIWRSWYQERHPPTEQRNGDKTEATA